MADNVHMNKPWEVAEETFEGSGEFHVRDADDFSVAVVDGETYARLIVQAVNAYQDLVEALDEAIFKIIQMADFFELDEAEVIEGLEAVLSKAKS